jgi:hypothetical protein
MAQKKGLFSLAGHPFLSPDKARRHPPHECQKIESPASLKLDPDSPRSDATPQDLLNQGPIAEKGKSATQNLRYLRSLLFKASTYHDAPTFPKPDSLFGVGALSINPGTTHTRRGKIMAETQTEMFDSRCTQPPAKQQPQPQLILA